MSKLPSFTAREILDILFAAGFEKVRTSGSHIRLRKETRLVTVAWHSKRTIPKGTLASILQQSGITRDTLLRLHKKIK